MYLRLRCFWETQPRTIRGASQIPEVKTLHMRSSILHIWEFILNDNLQTFKDRPTVSNKVVNLWFIFLLKTSVRVSTFLNRI